MKVLESYILRRIIGHAAGATAASLAIVWTTQALTRVNLVTDSGQSAGAFLFLATLLLPAIVPIVIPFAVLIASTQTLNGLNQDSELPVIHAAGLPRRVVFKPFIIVAVLASLVVIVFGNLVEPYSRQRARTLVAEARANFISLLIQENTFKRVDENLYMQIAARLEGGRLAGLFIADSRQADTDLIYYAREGAIVKKDGLNLLVMQDGEIHSRTPQSGALSVIRFNSYAFDLSEFTSNTGEVTLLPKDRTTADLYAPDPNDRVFKASPQQFVVEFHRRISEWLYVPAFTVLALVFTGRPRSNRTNVVLLTFYAVVSAFAVRWLGLILENMAENAAWATPLIYFPAIATIVLGGWFVFREQRPIASLQHLNEALHSFFGSRLQRISSALHLPGGSKE